MVKTSVSSGTCKSTGYANASASKSTTDCNKSRNRQLMEKTGEGRMTDTITPEAKQAIEVCISIILKEHDLGRDRHDDYQLGLYEAYREIKEHFGID